MSVSTRTRKGGRPTKAASEELRGKLLSAARMLFIRQGYSETTIEQVVAACGVGKDTLYRRFASKEALFSAIVSDALVRTVAWHDQHMANCPATPLAKLKHMSRWFLDANLEPELLALKREAVIQAMRSNTLVSEDVFTPKLVAAISDAHSAGEIHAPEPDFVATQLLAAIVLGPSNNALMGSDELSDSQARDEWFEKAWNLFVNGIAADGQ